jgi:hypothetical protein
LVKPAYPPLYIPPPASHQILPWTVTHTPTGWQIALLPTYSSPEQHSPTASAQQRSHEVRQYYEALSVLLDSNATLLRPLPHLLLRDFNAYMGTHHESPCAIPRSGDLDYPHHRDGDPQSHHQPTTHPSNLPTGRGRYLLNLCDTHGLLILNGRYPRSPTPPYTCQRTLASVSTNTIIDYAILTRTHAPMVLSCTVLIEPLLTFSDQNPIFLRLQSAPMPFHD